MLNHIANGADMIIGRWRPPTPVLRAILQLPVEKRMAFLQTIAARLRLPSRRFSDLDLDNAVRAVLWDMVQEFGLLPKISQDNPLDKCRKVSRRGRISMGMPGNTRSGLSYGECRWSDERRERPSGLGVGFDPPQQVRQLGDVGGDAPSLVAGGG